MAGKFAFKNQPRTRGLGGTGEGTPSIDILLDGKDVGTIHFNDHWNSKPDKGIRVWLMVHPSEKREAQGKPWLRMDVAKT
jgi:uracil-DNA glycosylase